LHGKWAVAVYKGLGKRLSKPSKAAGFSPACSFGSAQNYAWYVLCVLPSLLQNNMLCSKPYKYSVALLRRENAVMTTEAYSTSDDNSISCIMLADYGSRKQHLQSSSSCARQAQSCT